MKSPSGPPCRFQPRHSREGKDTQSFLIGNAPTRINRHNPDVPQMRPDVPLTQLSARSGPRTSGRMRGPTVPIHTVAGSLPCGSSRQCRFSDLVCPGPPAPPSSCGKRRARTAPVSCFGAGRRMLSGRRVLLPGRPGYAVAGRVRPLSDAVPADGNAQPEREMHGTLLDRNPLGRVLHRQQIGCDEEVDPAGAQVHGQAHGAALVVDDRVAARQREPPCGLEVHRTGEVVARLELPEAGRVEQAESDFVTPYLVLDAGVERGVEALGRTLRPGRRELQQVHVEVGLFGRLAVFDLHARELHAFDRAAL